MFLLGTRRTAQASAYGSVCAVARPPVALAKVSDQAMPAPPLPLEAISAAKFVLAVSSSSEVLNVRCALAYAVGLHSRTTWLSLLKRWSES